jgi:restriction system protein
MGRRKNNDAAMIGLLVLAAPFALLAWLFEYANRHPWVWVVLIIIVGAAISQIPRILRERKAKADLLFSVARPLEMTPSGYEEYCAEVLRRDGWATKVTRASGDQGVDVIAEIQGVKLAVQCKRYVRPVGNKAVQEVLAGKAFYGAHAAAVVSTAPYTPAAQALAKKCGILLLSHADLPGLKKTFLGNRS